MTLSRIMARAIADVGGEAAARAEQAGGGADDAQENADEDAEEWRCPDGSGMTLLHAAASSGSAATVRVLLALRAPSLCGTPASATGAHSLTPCHIAAASALADEASADAIASLLRAAPGGAAAWARAATEDGTRSDIRAVTPAQLRALCGAEVT
jgi:hypothetical protein